MDLISGTLVFTKCGYGGEKKNHSESSLLLQIKFEYLTKS